ncbi:hypothetical protein TorRG33x02_250630 [Trema orientale]|uniref:Uncharacterized protein n=1 Tax=Trema orientale TaxID=63057 RepID=A0A2P5DIF7_TREOI|nr:hypothetical protein TorRG33x02_250630 [Trema orientale]
MTDNNRVQIYIQLLEFSEETTRKVSEMSRTSTNSTMHNAIHPNAPKQDTNQFNPILETTTRKQ